MEQNIGGRKVSEHSEETDQVASLGSALHVYRREQSIILRGGKYLRELTKFNSEFESTCT